MISTPNNVRKYRKKGHEQFQFNEITLHALNLISSLWLYLTRWLDSGTKMWIAQKNVRAKRLQTLSSSRLDCYRSVNFRNRFCCSHLNQKTTKYFLISAQGYKMGQIKKRKKKRRNHYNKCPHFFDLTCFRD